MNRVITGIIGIGIIISAAIFTFLLIANKPKAEIEEEDDESLVVDIITVSPQNAQLTVNSQGIINPRTETTLVAEVSGTIVKVSPNLAVGLFFNKGDVLLEIDPRDYETALKRAEAALASAKARLSEEEARSKQAKNDWESINPGKPASPFVLRKPQLTQAKINVYSAEADLEKAKLDLSRTRIKASYDGMIQSKLVDIGQYVTLGTPLIEIFATDIAEIRLPVGDRDLAFLPNIHQLNKQPITVKLTGKSAGKEYTWNANITRHEGMIDTNSRVTYLVAKIIDPYQRQTTNATIPPMPMGTFVAANILGKQMTNIIAIPRHTVNEQQQVLIVDDKQKLQHRDIEILYAKDDKVFLSSGLDFNEKVITSPVEIPINGMQVSINNGEETEDQPASLVESDADPLTAG